MVRSVAVHTLMLALTRCTYMRETALPPTLCHSACLSLASSVPNIVHYPVSTNSAYWSLQQSQASPPLCIVSPQTPEDVAVALRTILDHDCPFNVKGGGHSPLEGSSTAPESILIDTEQLLGLDLSDPHLRTVGIGAGYRWKDLYRSLETVGLGVVGTRNGMSGIVGSILGGGLSYHTSRYGLACDSVEAFELVLPNATIVLVTHSNQPELFRALRGGGVYTGIVTRVALRTFPVQLVWDTTRFWTFDASTSQEIFANHERRSANSPDDVLMSTLAIMSKQESPSGFEVSERVVYSSAAESGLHDCMPMESGTQYTVQPIRESMVCTNVSTMAGKMDNGNPDDHYNIWGTITVVNNAAVNKRISEIFYEEVQILRLATGSSNMFAAAVFNALTTTAIRQMEANGGNSLGIHTGDGSLIIVNFTLRWSTPRLEALLEDFMRRLLDAVSAAAKAESALHPYVFENHAYREQNVAQGRGAGNVLQLDKLQRMLDPGGRFRRLRLGHFKSAGEEQQEQEQEFLHLVDARPGVQAHTEL